MLKKTVTYEDWNGKTRTEDFYFNLTRAECIQLEYNSGVKSLTDYISTLIDNDDMSIVVKTIKKVLLLSYGIKSDDGKRFIKNDEVREAFEQNPAFDTLYMELATDAKKAAEFFAGVIPGAITEKLGPDPAKTLYNAVEEYTETGTLPSNIIQFNNTTE